MRRIALALCLSFLLVGCGQDEAADGNQGANAASITVEGEGILMDEQVGEVTQASETETIQAGGIAQRTDGVRSAWTDYSQYAAPDETGYAYYMHADPDISSEIFAMDEFQSQDVLLFTFDDAPNLPESDTLRIAETLKELDVNAIFLVNGMYLETEEGRQIARQVHEMGFELGNHTFGHPNLRELSYEDQYFELNRTNELIAEVTDGAPVRWMRPPFGLFDMDTILICNELGMQLMTWSFGYDWMDEYFNGPQLAEVSLNNDYLRSGANILMHDLPWTADAVRDMANGYRDQGYHIVDPYLILHQENSLDPL